MPELKKLLELRAALTALKGPLGNVPAFRKKLQSLLGDEANRAKLMAELGLGPGQGQEVGAVTTMADPKTEAAAPDAKAQPRCSLLDDILAETKLKPSDDAYDVAKRGVTAFITELLAPGRAIERVDKALVDAMIAEIDARMSAQVNEILHHPAFQKLESAWRGLRFLIDRTDFRENIQVELLNVSKDELLQDFEDAPEVPKSGLYNIVYTREYGVFGGKPYGAICANYEFGPGPQDIALLQKCAAVAAMAHAPFITAPRRSSSAPDKTSSTCPTSRTSRRSSRARSTRAGTASARPRTRATSACACRASCSACPTARTRSR